MAWNDLESNQMVSFTDSIGGNFTFKPGQSSIVSPQCMTKAQSFEMYFLKTTTDTDTVASNQLMRKDYWISSVFSGIMMVGYANGSYGYVNAYIGGMTNTDLSSIAGANSVLTGLAYNTSARTISIAINNGSTTIIPNGWTSVRIVSTTFFRTDFAIQSQGGPNWVFVLFTNNNPIGTTVDAARLVVIT